MTAVQTISDQRLHAHGHEGRRPLRRLGGSRVTEFAVDVARDGTLRVAALVTLLKKPAGRGKAGKQRLLPHRKPDSAQSQR